MSKSFFLTILFLALLGGRAGAEDVLVIDLKHEPESGSDLLVKGFPDQEAAKEYARRRVRDSIEELRSQGTSTTKLRKLWLIYGEDASVVKGNYKASSELDAFLRRPAGPQERDWRSLETRFQVTKEKLHRSE